MISLYLHIPFCVKRCLYCDFNTFAGQQELIPVYVKALCEEISRVANQANTKLSVKTIFFGGGTPSLLALSDFEHILSVIEDNFFLDSKPEITIEANPGTTTYAQLNNLRILGVNRISFGIQSFRPEALSFLGRIHNGEDALRSIEWARKAGFNNINFDMIYGLPGQTLAQWERDLEIVLKIGSEHISLYSLIVEEGTPLNTWVQKGVVEQPDDDIVADMYELATERLTSGGYRQYEISNWARNDQGRDLRCQHNLQYWRNLPYLGFGAGAHGFAAKHRMANVGGILDYILKIQTGGKTEFPFSPANQSVEVIDRKTEIRETLMLGLRLTDEGVSLEGFKERFGEDVHAIFREQIDRLKNDGLIEISNCLRLTKRGRLLGNLVFLEFVTADI